jgi:diguanylate cyclase (GGDEF)-like protein
LAGRKIVALGWAYALCAVVLVVAYPFLPEGGRLAVVRVVALASIAAVVVGSRTHAPGSARPRWVMILILGLVLTNVGLMVQLFPGQLAFVLAELIDASGNVVLLTAAVSLVASRGGADLGGVVDTAIVGLAVGGLLWNFVLLPIERANQVALVSEVRAFLVIFSLAGVVGALVRLGRTGSGLLFGLWILSVGLVFAIASNAVLALSRFPWHHTASEMMFMVAYTCVGLFGLDAEAYRLAAARRPIRDDLTAGRLLFLGIALAIIPIALGLTELLGGHVNGVLLILAGGLMTVLVMVRIRKLYADRQEAEQALGHMASHDVLTDLVNRREFERRLSLVPTGEQPSALLFCDLDGFKNVNDSLGHYAGDQLLIAVADRLVASVRKSDTVSRLGGDEFLILLRNAQPHDVDAVLGRISAEFSKPMIVGSSSVTVGASIGVVAFVQPTEPEELIQRADHAMYRAKEAAPSGSPVRIASG